MRHLKKGFRGTQAYRFRGLRAEGIATLRKRSSRLADIKIADGG